MASAAPQLRRLLATETKKHFIITTVVCVASFAIAKVCYQRPRFQNYEKFHKTYDAKADYKRMKAAGVFTPLNK